MSHVLVAHAPEEIERAVLVAEKLGALGYEVRHDADVYRGLSPFERRKLARSVEEAAVVLVLWSREAGEAPALRAAAERAAASGKLALARLDSAVPPLPGAANLSGWYGLEGRSWRQVVSSVGLVAKKPAKRAAPAPAPKTASAPARAAAASVSAPETQKAKKSGGAALAIVTLVLLAAMAAGAYYAWSTGLITAG